MNKKKIIVLLISIIAVVFLIACTTITIMHFTNTQKLEDIQVQMESESKFGNSEFRQMGAICTPESKNSYLLYVSKSEKEQENAEAYIVMRKGLFNTNAFLRFSIKEHFTANNIIGFSNVEITDGDKKIPYFFIYSSHKDDLRHIYVLLKDNQTGEIQKLQWEYVNEGCFAQIRETESTNMEVMSIVCKDSYNNIIYNYELNSQNN